MMMKDEEIKRLIQDGHMTDYQIYTKWLVFPTMTIYFDNHEPIDIPKRKWESYWEVLDKAEYEKVSN